MAKVTRMIALALTIQLVVGSVQAAPQQPRAKVTGAALVRDMLARPKDDAINNFRRERAMGYIDGVMDAGVGHRWCPAGRQIPHELNYLVIEEMARLPAAALKGNAASLVAAALAREYPCKPGATP